MTSVVLSSLARRDLGDIWFAVAEDDRVAADRILRALDRRIAGLARHPKIGRRRADLRAGLRVLVEAPFLVVYEIEPDEDLVPPAIVRIARVVDGRRDLEALF